MDLTEDCGQGNSDTYSLHVYNTCRKNGIDASKTLSRNLVPLVEI